MFLILILHKPQTDANNQMKDKNYRKMTRDLFFIAKICRGQRRIITTCCSHTCRSLLGCLKVQTQNHGNDTTAQSVGQSCKVSLRQTEAEYQTCRTEKTQELDNRIMKNKNNSFRAWNSESIRLQSIPFLKVEI